MSGIEPAGELSESQMAALSGGPLLQTEAAMTLMPGSTPAAVLLARNSFKKGALRLYRMLVQSRLAMPILILIAQQRQACVFTAADDAADTPIKSLSSTFDTCVAILFQYAHFLAAQGAEDHAQRVPLPADWIRRFGLDASMAFHLARPRLLWDMQQSSKSEDKDMHVDGDVEVVWHAALQSTVQGIASVMPANSISALGAPFFTTFWQLALPDVTVPMERYQQELSRLRQSIQDVDAAADLSESLKKSARVRLQESIAHLTTELKEQTLAYQATRRRLQAEKVHWFAPDVHRGQLVQQLVVHCLHPRALFSPTDAVYTAKFLRMLHTLGTPALPTLAVYDLSLIHI